MIKLTVRLRQSGFKRLMTEDKCNYHNQGYSVTVAIRMKELGYEQGQAVLTRAGLQCGCDKNRFKVRWHCPQSGLRCGMALS